MTRHLGMQVSAYVDRRLDAPTLYAFDRHLVACLVCRYAADEERRLLTSLRSGPTPGLSPNLQSMLIAMGAGGLTGPDARAHGGFSGPAARGPARVSDTTGATALTRANHAMGTTASTAWVPSIPAAPLGVRQVRLPTVAPTAPAQHRSPRRAAMVAGLAAGASAAAAIGLTFVGPGPGASSVARPAPRTPGVTSLTAIPAAFTGIGLSSPRPRQVLERPAR